MNTGIAQASEKSCVVLRLRRHSGICFAGAEKSERGSILETILRHQKSPSVKTSVKTSVKRLMFRKTGAYGVVLCSGDTKAEMHIAGVGYGQTRL